MPSGSATTLRSSPAADTFVRIPCRSSGSDSAAIRAVGFRMQRKEMLPGRESAISSLFGVLGAEGLNRHYADFFLHFRGVDHSNGIPGAAIEEAAVWAFADALLASDAKDGVDLNAAKGWMVLIGHPEHAVFDRAVLDAGRRAGASGTALGDYCQFFGLFLPRRSKALGFRFKLELVGDHSDGPGRSPRCGRHGRNYSVKNGGRRN